MRGDERLGAVLQLAGAAGRDQNLAVVRIETGLNRHRSHLQREVAAGRRSPSMPKASSTGLSRSCEFACRQAAATSNTRRER